MKLPEFGFLEKCKIVGKTLLVQVCLFITLLLLAWGSQALYAKLDRTEFPTPVQITDADKLDENAKGKALVDAIVDELAKDERVAAAYDLWNQMREEVCRTYSEQLPERLPLSKQKEFTPPRC